jgi:D-amino peptidase
MIPAQNRFECAQPGAITAMRVFIVSDMEGVAGITNWDQVTGGKSLYEEGRKLYTEEINAAVRGARAGGATEIVVMDCHGAGEGWSFNSLIPDQLDPGCEFVVQHEWTEYTGVLEEGCDAALFIAMHAKAGTPDGVMCHTVSGSQWTNLWFNGVSVGESGINAALCGHWGCPVLLVTGDVAACREGRALLGDDLTTVAVKTGLGRFSARHIPPVRARQMIEAGATAALKDLKAVAPYVPASPVEIKVEFNTPDLLEKYRFVSGVEIVEDRAIVSRADDWWTAWRQFYFITW